MDRPEILFHDDFRESVEGSGLRGSLTACSTYKAHPSPFRNPYPLQLKKNPTPGYAGELRGYYRRSDGKDRWKPSWSAFNHPRDANSVHKGVDIYAPVGTEVVAVVEGWAEFHSTPSSDLGIRIGINFTAADGSKWDLLYGHLSSLVGASRRVKKGEVIGKTGCTGNAEDGTCATANTCGGYSSHLHLAIKEPISNGVYCDPLAFFGWTLDYQGDLRDVDCKNA